MAQCGHSRSGCSSCFTVGSYGYFSYQNKARLDGLVNAVTELANQHAISVPNTPSARMVFGDDEAVTNELAARAASKDADVDPAQAAQDGICQGLAPPADPVTLVDNPPGTFGCDAFPEHPEFKADFDSGSEANNQFNAGAILSNIDQLRDAGRSLIAAALHAEPGVPVGYRYLAWSYGDDKSRPEGEMLAEAGRCLTRAISISCGDRGGITDLAYGAEALSQIFDQYKLRFQQAILHGQLGHELLDPARQPPGIEERRRVELRRRGAEALAFAAHYLRDSADCTSGAPAKACAVVPAWYDTAAKAFVGVLDGIATAPFHDDTSTELAYGAGMFGLFWGQDRDFREAARKYTS